MHAVPLPSPLSGPFRIYRIAIFLGMLVGVAIARRRSAPALTKRNLVAQVVGGTFVPLPQ